MLHDEDLAQAILDRVLERGRLLRLDGPSVRTLHVNLDEAMKEDSDQDADLVRISGKNRSEFPEPTALALRNRIDRVRGRRGDACVEQLRCMADPRPVLERASRPRSPSPGFKRALGVWWISAPRMRSRGKMPPDEPPVRSLWPLYG